MNKQVLQFILEENSPNGIIECQVDNWLGISYKIPRNKWNEASDLEYINNTGIYILFGDDEDTAEKTAYIGETDRIYERLSNHNRRFWNECLIFVSKDNSINKADVKHMEHELWRLGVEANRYKIVNDNEPQDPSLSRGDKIKDEKFMNKIKIVTDMLGYKLFTKLVDENIDSENILHLTNKGTEYARGMLTDEGFVVLKGSKIKDGIYDSISNSLKGFLSKERTSADIVDNTYVKDHLFTSPSMAAIAILGRNSNGYTEWKNKDNVSLKKMMSSEE